MVMKINLQFFGGRGSSSGFGKLRGNVVISKETTPHGTVFYMTGTRDVLSHWDVEDNYHEKKIKIKEKVRSSFKSREEADGFLETLRA